MIRKLRACVTITVSSAAAGLYEIDGLTDIERVQLSTPFGEPVGRVRRRPAGRREAGVPAAPRPRPPHPAARDQLPRQRLGHEEARRRVDPLGVGGRLDERGDPRPATSSSSISSSIAPRRAQSSFFGDGVAGHVGFADPICGELAAHVYAGGQGGGRARAPGRHLRGHGRADVLDARRVEPLSQLGRRASSA